MYGAFLSVWEGRRKPLDQRLDFFAVFFFFATFFAVLFLAGSFDFLVAFFTDFFVLFLGAAFLDFFAAFLAVDFFEAFLAAAFLVAVFLGAAGLASMFVNLLVVIDLERALRFGSRLL